MGKMSRSSKEVQKGEMTDRDVRALMRVFKSREKLLNIKKAIANTRLPKEDLARIVPIHLIMLAFAAASQDFERNLQQVPPRVRRLLKKAKSLIGKHFPNLVQHPGAKAIIYEFAQSRPKDKEERLEEGSEITSFDWYYVWGGVEGPPKLRPGVHLFFRNRDKKLLLESQLDWTNLGFLAASLTGIFRHLMEKGKILAEKQMLDVSVAPMIGLRIRQLKDHAEELERLAANYGIPTKPTKP